ncbi:hypothetical protein F2P56_006803 [Juglans regia]|uniref:Endonuclease/exonuclease/phosphatase domain-containing protein n=1 Tax=Juglans regia TaxID=51240 RepID=A0A834D505_JUGRE|nr:hypothetical protein F2P56_006803 [Juglans regia]
MFWNIRGIGTSKKRLRSLVRVHKPSVLFLAEPFRDNSHLSYWRNYFSFSECLSNADKEGKIWCFWIAGLRVEVMGGSNQFISLMINSTVLISVVYAKCRYLERRVLWEDLLVFNTLQLPHVILGDFNIVRNDSERRGGCPRLLTAMDDFCSFIDNGGLVELPFLRNKYSWCNGQTGMARSWAQLDRSLCNLKFLEAFPSVHNQYLPRRSSDHSPMLLGLSDCLTRYGLSSFKFHFMWTTHEDFWPYVSSSWEVPMYGSGLWKLAGKLKRLKQALRTWNKEVFGWTSRHIKNIEMRVEEGETNLQERYSEDVEMDVLANKMELDVWLRREENRLAQQFKRDWILQGEASSSFFKALQTRNHNMVLEMNMNDGRILSNPEAIHEEACVYFHDFLKASQSNVLPNLADLISGEVSEEENNIFGGAPLLEEVKNALFSIPKDSSPSPDGFGSGFYQHCWSLVKNDLFEAITDFFSGIELPRFYTASHCFLY